MPKKALQDYVAGLSSEFLPVLEGYDHSDYFPLDLSVTNTELDSVDTTSAEAIANYIDNKTKQAGRKLAYGGYLEKRSIYNRSDHFIKEGSLVQRDIHLGMDLWAPAATPVLAAADGILHSFRNNNNFGNYGPCIILEHKVGNQKFYTLYGHLSRKSLLGLRSHAVIKRGTCIGTLGDASENGDYAPHLHFQLIADMQGKAGDYPGVCSSGEVEFYKANCPDPNLLLHI
ncbi:MAG: peptidoglycan DD-metalloendopeptidase family protein [Leeuwenhoekiella sp.]